MGVITDTFNNLIGRETSGQKAASAAGNIQADAATKAADVSAGGYRKAGDISAQGAQDAYDLYNKLFTQGAEYTDPWRTAGANALQTQQGALGLLGADQQAAAYKQFSESPGQKFAREQAEKTILRNASATGGLGGGNVLNALQQNAIGHASQNYDNWLAQIGALSNNGLGAASNAANYNMQGAGDLSNLIQAKSGALSSAELGATGAYASGITGSAAAKAGGILTGQQANAAQQNSLLNLGGQVAGAAILSDKNAKHDVSKMDNKKAFDIVMKMPMNVWRYLPKMNLGNDLHFGPMAQEAPSEIKVSGKEAIDLHDELMLVVGAMQYMIENNLAGVKNV